jgi:hypothetical protein
LFPAADMPADFAAVPADRTCPAAEPADGARTQGFDDAGDGNGLLGRVVSLDSQEDEVMADEIKVKDLCGPLTLSKEFIEACEYEMEAVFPNGLNSLFEKALRALVDVKPSYCDSGGCICCRFCEAWLDFGGVHEIDCPYIAAKTLVEKLDAERGS